MSRQNDPYRPSERLTVAETADELGVSVRTVRRFIDDGELVAYKITARKTYVLREDLHKFLESRRTSPALARGR